MTPHLTELVFYDCNLLSVILLQNVIQEGCPRDLQQVDHSTERHERTLQACAPTKTAKNHACLHREIR